MWVDENTVKVLLDLDTKTVKLEEVAKLRLGGIGVRPTDNMCVKFGARGSKLFCLVPNNPIAIKSSTIWTLKNN